jgi:hypothetical protein
MLRCFGLLVAHSVSYRGTATCPELGVNRSALGDRQSDAIDSSRKWGCIAAVKTMSIFAARGSQPAERLDDGAILSVSFIASVTAALPDLPCPAVLRAAASWFNDLVADSDHHSLRAGHRSKPSTEMLDVFLNCSVADMKRLANLPR